jgi:DNA-binding CsgD family transcriptional regulator
MDKRVYIVHGSAIVQNGLADILRKNFKCKIKCYSDLSGLSQNEEDCSFKSIIFVEDVIANSNDYLVFLDESNELKSYCIVNCNSEKIPANSQYTLFLYNSPDEIYEQVKHVFKQQVLVEDELEGLSNREIDVLKLVALGYANKEIADKLHISTHTVMSHRKNMTEKLGIKSISGLTVYAIINNYIDTTNLDVKDLI